jgi:hypothetical protein
MLVLGSRRCDELSVFMGIFISVEGTRSAVCMHRCHFPCIYVNLRGVSSLVWMHACMYVCMHVCMYVFGLTHSANLLYSYFNSNCQQEHLQQASLIIFLQHFTVQHLYL